MDYNRKAQIFMKKFHGRRDIYGKKWVSKEQTRADGTPLVGYAPQCANFWEDVCHIKNKTGISCSECSHQQYNPVTEEVVLKHIRGEEEHLYYLINPEDNTVWFSAIDFDCKPGKEEKGYTFSDVSKCSKVLKDWGVPHAIARSTTSGYHLYVFYTEKVAANKPLAITHHLFEELGWSERARQGIKPIPEIFPKQATVGADGLGNGIKPPMIEPQMQKGKNCWVTEEDVIIPIDEQWQYFTDIPRCRPEVIDAIIKEYEINCDLYLSGASVFRSTPAGKKGGSGKYKTSISIDKLGWSVEKMLESCAAFRSIRDKVLAGEVLGHDEGFALYHTARHTEDGKQWFLKNVTGWGENDAQMKQLNQSDRVDYAPRTCRDMQSKGLCKPGTKCLEKKPPYRYENGKKIVDPEYKNPESWPDPSPIRFANDDGDTFLKKLKEEAEYLKGVKDPDILMGKLKEIVQKAKIFDPKQRGDLEKHIKSLKVIKSREVGHLFGEAIIQRDEEIKEKIDEDPNMVLVGDDPIVKRGDGESGYDKIVYVKGRPKHKPLTNTSLEIKSIVTLIHDDGERETVYKGEIYSAQHKFRVPFEVSSNDWVDFKKLREKLKSLAHVKLNIPNNKVMETVANAAEEFAAKDPAVSFDVFRTTQGWYKDAYITPSVIITKEGVKTNDQYKVDLSGKNSAKEIDFKIVGEDELREILFHMKANLLTAFPKEMIYTGLSHTLIAGVRSQLGIKQKPTLWYEGLSGTGKSEITKILQSFYGPELGEKLPGWHTTPKYIMDYAYVFKDCLAVVDDYKETLNPYIKRAAKEVVQFSYDDVVRGTMTRTGQAKEGKLNRALLMASGEDTPSQEASVIARMIIIDCHKRDNEATKDQFEASKEKKKDYCAVTPFFINWVLQQDQKKIEEQLEKNKKVVMTGINGVQNADRIASNLGINMLGWQMFVSFCEDHGVVSRQEGDKFINDHEQITNEIKFAMAARCAEEQQSNIYVETLVSLLSTGKVRIEGLPGFDLRESADSIGFVKETYNKPGDHHYNKVYIHPGISMRVVMEENRHSGLSLKAKSLSNQLIDDGLIVDKGKKKPSKSVRYKGAVNKMWVLDLEKLGLVDPRNKRDFKTIEGGKQDTAEIDQGGLL